MEYENDFKLIATIKDSDFGTDFNENYDSYTDRRFCARGVLVKDGKIIVLHSKVNDYIQLPGGNMEPGETPEEGVCRELQEESGYTLKSVTPLGQVVELRQFQDRRTANYLFLCEADEFVGTNFMDDEVAEGFENQEIENLKTALELFKSAAPDSLKGRFINRRDTYALELSLDFLEKV